MYDLTMLVVSGLGGASLYEASGINEMGQVIANGCVGEPGTESCSAFLLDPISSPLAPEVIPALTETMLAVVALLVLVTGIAALKRSQIASRT
jgi:hypothetical protein